MPTLLLSDRASSTIHKLVTEYKDVEELKELSLQLSTPPVPSVKDSHYPPGTVVEHQSLVRASKWAASHAEVDSRDTCTLSALLHGAKIALRVLPKPERSAELEKILQKIKLAQDQAEYDEMTNTSNWEKRTTKSVPFGFRNSSNSNANIWQSRAERSDKEEWDEVKRQLGAIFNVGLSVCAVAVATWWAAGNADPIWKTLVALPLSLLVAIAEVALYSRHWSNVQKRKMTRR